jgi:hypothetical protein
LGFLGIVGMGSRQEGGKPHALRGKCTGVELLGL